MNYQHEVKDDILIMRLSGDLIGEESGLNLVGLANDFLNQDIKLLARPT